MVVYGVYSCSGETCWLQREGQRRLPYQRANDIPPYTLKIMAQSCQRCGNPIPDPIGRKHWHTIRVFCSNDCRLKSQKRTAGYNIERHEREKQQHV